MRSSLSAPIAASALILAASAASAQTVTARAQIEADILDAYTKLATSPLALRMDATETNGSRTTSTTAWLHWLNTADAGRDRVRIQLYIERNSLPYRRIVLDGQTIWAYDYGTNSYAAVPVDRNSGNQSTTYRDSIDRTISGLIPATVADLWRVGREIAGGSTGASYRTWMPGVDPQNGIEGYDGRWAYYDLPGATAGSLSKSLVFELSEQEDGSVAFGRIHRVESSTLRGLSRSKDTVITLEDPAPELLATSPEFRFQPPQNARSVAPTRFVNF